MDGGGGGGGCGAWLRKEHITVLKGGDGGRGEEGGGGGHNISLGVMTKCDRGISEQILTENLATDSQGNQPPRM